MFGYLDTNKRKILKQIEDLDIQDDHNKLEGSTRWKRMDLVSQLRVTKKKLDSLFR